MIHTPGITKPQTPYIVLRWEATTTGSMLYALLITAFLNIIAFWKGDRMLLYLAAIANLVFGFYYYDTIGITSVLIVVLGVYCVARGAWAT